jgi:hypothetical protein
MSTAVSSFVTPIDPIVPVDTMAAVVDRLGGVPLSRIRAVPPPGTTVTGDQELLGGDLLPGFAVKLSEVFTQAKRGLPPQLLPALKK